MNKVLRIFNDSFDCIIGAACGVIAIPYAINDMCIYHTPYINGLMNRCDWLFNKKPLITYFKLTERKKGLVALIFYCIVSSIIIFIYE